MIENSENSDMFFDVHQVSRLLHINEKKIYALAKEGRLPGTKVTGKWLFPKKELEAFIKKVGDQKKHDQVLGQIKVVVNNF